MRKALLALGGFWAIGVLLLVASLFGAVGRDHFRDAPICSPAQTFTSDYCRITVEATVTALTREQITTAVGGRTVSATVYLHGSLPGDVAGLAVRVTFYQGIPVHVESDDLTFDTAAAPIDHTAELRVAGLFFLLGGTALVCLGNLIESRRSRSIC